MKCSLTYSVRVSKTDSWQESLYKNVGGSAVYKYGIVLAAGKGFILWRYKLMKDV
jgi:hypothetical protein